MFIRSSYGVEFDNQQRAPHHHLLWGLVVLIPIIAAFFLFLRGCSGLKQGVLADDDPLRAERYDAHEEQNKRAKPSLTQHLISHWFGTDTSTTVGVHTATQPDETRSQQSKTQPTPASIRKLPADVQKLVAQAAAAENANNLIEARMIYHHLLTRSDIDTFLQTFEAKIAEINLKLLFSRQPMPEKTTWRVGSGDSISKIARKTGTNPEYISVVNEIDRPTQLKLDMELWVMKNPAFAMFIDRTAASLIVTLNGRFFKRYSLDASDAKALTPGAYRVRSRGKKDQPDSTRSAQMNQKLNAACWILVETRDDRADVAFGFFSRIARTTAQQPSLSGLLFPASDIEELYLYLPLGTLITVIN